MLYHVLAATTTTDKTTEVKSKEDLGLLVRDHRGSSRLLCVNPMQVIKCLKIQYYPPYGNYSSGSSNSIYNLKYNNGDSSIATVN